MHYWWSRRFSLIVRIVFHKFDIADVIVRRHRFQSCTLKKKVIITGGFNSSPTLYIPIYYKFITPYLRTHLRSDTPSDIVVINRNKLL